MSGMSDATIEPPINASPWEREIFDHLVDHMRIEGAMLEQYVESAEASDSEALKYLVNLLVEDERRHHRWFADLAKAVKSSAELDITPSPIPRLDLDRHDWRGTLGMIEQLLANEEKDRVELKRLLKDLRENQDNSLWELLVEMMQLDTEKHIAMLKFAKKHAKPRS